MAVSAGLVALGYVVAPRGEGLGYDSTFYVAMVNGLGDAVPGPFKFRVLIPFVASLIPASPTTALLIISYLSLFGAYLFVIRACDTLGLSVRDSAFGLFAIWGSTWHLYHYFNPYMTDPFALFALSLMITALLRDAFWPFAIAALIGAMGRETTAFLVPAWFATRQVTRTLWLIAAVVLIVVLPRYWLAADGDLGIAGAFNSSDTLFQPFIFARQLLATWGFVWFLAIAGMWYIGPAYRGRVAASFAALFLGALAASAMATDTGRMFGFLAPIMAIGTAQFYAVARRHSSALAWMLVGLIAVQGFFNTPQVMFDSQAWIVGWPRRTFLIAELGVGIWILARLAGWAGETGGAGKAGK